MQRETTNMREAVSVQKRVAVALYKLCSSAEDRTVANLFDLGRSTVNTIYREFCDIVVEALEDQWVRMLAADDMTDHIREFYAVTGFPQAVGALDGCHFPVSPPKENAIGLLQLQRLVQRDLIGFGRPQISLSIHQRRFPRQVPRRPCLPQLKLAKHCDRTDISEPNNLCQ
ncbi:hypothetical protein MTO96_034685 [Rhipicephalus appendiculatus]